MTQIDRAARYHEQADEARTVAFLTDIPELRAAFLYIAGSYEELARLHENFHKHRHHWN